MQNSSRVTTPVTPLVCDAARQRLPVASLTPPSITPFTSLVVHKVSNGDCRPSPCYTYNNVSLKSSSLVSSYHHKMWTLISSKKRKWRYIIAAGLLLHFISNSQVFTTFPRISVSRFTGRGALFPLPPHLPACLHLTYSITSLDVILHSRSTRKHSAPQFLLQYWTFNTRQRHELGTTPRYIATRHVYIRYGYIFFSFFFLPFF